MENFLFKKSYQLKTFSSLPYKSLWGANGIFTTIRMYGKNPDLILIDGGKGQLNAVQEELLFLGFNNLNLASIAKKNEQIFLPGVYEPINLEENSPELFIIQQIRDEAHRFAITFHRSKRSGTSLRSKLDEIEGLGPKRKKALLNRFGSINGIREADLKTLESIPGLPKQVAEKIKETL